MTGAAAVARQDRSLQSAQPLTILLLEDSPLDAQLVEAQLEGVDLHFDLTRVSSHEGFNEALAARRFDIILSDYNIPGFDGTAALAAAHLACPEVPFLFVSGALGEDKAIELLKRGATDYVLKDRLERLVPSVERALREARGKADRKRAEQKLRERERTLSTLMANLPGMAFRGGPQAPWLLEFASEGCLPLTGWRPEAFYVGGEVTWAAISHPDDVERVAREAEAAFSVGRQLTVTYRIRTKDGNEKWVWERSIPLYGADGEVESIEGFITDITQQKKAEEEVRRRAEFEQQLIGIVSHDLRNPLHAITLGATTLVRREGLDDKTTNTARRILSSAERATRMIRDLLDFTQARLGGGIPVHLQPLDLHAQVAVVVEELQHTHADRELRLSCEGDMQGQWDPDRIAQVVTNLVGNALKYSTAGTPVTIRTFADADAVVLEVKNHGEPIASERLPHLFKPLSRGVANTDVQTRSIGLGLYIVDSIVRAHGGTIDARSSAEEGTTFAVRLPRKPANTTPRSPPTRS